jgi:hypothetical protein
MTSPWPPLTIEGFVATPDHYLFAFEREQAIFAAMDRAAYHRSIFLDRRISPASPQMAAVPTDALVRVVDDHPPATAETGWIFHIAHCGSTLLARALDRPDQSLVLREPLALRQLGVERAQSAVRTPAADWSSRLRLTAALAGRRYRPDAPAIVKANVPVNFIASNILESAPTSPAIFLYFPLRAYLLAILRSPDHRNWVMNVTGQLQPALAGLAGDLDGIGIPERAAALWMAQMKLYADAIERFAGARSLQAEDLFGEPRPTVAAAAAHLGIQIPEQDLEAVVAGPLFSTYSKSPTEAFDNSRRLELQAESARRLGPEIDQARRWVDHRLTSCPLPHALDRPLAGSSPLLLDG